MNNTIDGWYVDGRRETLFVERANLNIWRPSMVDFVASGKWKARLVYRASGGRYTVAFDLYEGRTDERIAMQLDALVDFPRERVLFKNGKPRFYLGDTDHGTPRIMGDGILGCRKGQMSR